MAGKDKPIKKLPLKDFSTHMHIDLLDHALSTAISELNESERRGLKAATENKRKGGSVSRKRGGGYVTPKKNIIDDNASKRSRLRSEKRRKKAIRAAASKKRGGKIMQGYKAGGKV